MSNADPAPQPRPARIEAVTLDPALYLVSTPIGTARDITLRALDVLNSADVLAAEDTRTLRHLMEIHDVPLRGRRIVAYHDHNANARRPQLIAALREGKSVAYCSDAGTPMVADPGFRLARSCVEEGLKVLAVPGASAALAALAVAGLPSDRFHFAGFAPQPMGAKTRWLKELLDLDATVIAFDSPKRVKQTLGVLCDLDPNRATVLCRELTKKFEEVMRGTAKDVFTAVPDEGLRGEVVLLMDRASGKEVGDMEIRAALSALLGEFSVRDAAERVAAEFGLPRRGVYQTALMMKDDP